MGRYLGDRVQHRKWFTYIRFRGFLVGSSAAAGGNRGDSKSVRKQLTETPQRHWWNRPCKSSHPAAPIGMTKREPTHPAQTSTRGGGNPTARRSDRQQKPSRPLLRSVAPIPAPFAPHKKRKQNKSPNSPITTNNGTNPLGLVVHAAPRAADDPLPRAAGPIVRPRPVDAGAGLARRVPPARGLGHGLRAAAAGLHDGRVAALVVVGVFCVLWFRRFFFWFFFVV